MLVIHQPPRARANHKPCTTFVGNINVFTGQNMNKNKTPAQPVDTNLLEICNDPLPGGRATVANKYEEIFKKLEPGQCIKCASGQAAKIGNALRKHIQVHKQNFLVRSTERYPADGQGRVWKLPNPAIKKA